MTAADAIQSHLPNMALFRCSSTVMYVCIILLIFVGNVISADDPKPKAKQGELSKHKARLQPINAKLSALAKEDVFSFADSNWCTKANRIIRKESLALKRISNVISGLEQDDELEEEEQKFDVNRFRVFSQELNETMGMIEQSFTWLDHVLQGNYKDIINMREVTKQRLDALKDATLKEEQEFNAIIKAQETLKKWNETKVEGLIDELLKEVAEAADKLESDLDEHIFANAAALAVANPEMNNIETVIRLEGVNPNPPAAHGNESQVQDADAGVMKLVDSQDNQFVLTKPKDTTVPQEDHHFIKDVIMLMLASFVLGWLCSIINMPSMFGYILGGLILGPSVLNILKSPVQVESLGEFGVFFILFAVGLEFSPDVIRKVFKVAFLGGLVMMLLMVLGGLGVGLVVGGSPSESAFLASCLYLSSTPLVVKFLHTGSSEESNVPDSVSPPDGAMNTDYGSILLGILVMQDVMLGVLMALLPNMAVTSTSHNGDNNKQALVYLFIALRLIAAMAGILAVSWIMSKLLIGRLYKSLFVGRNKEITVLATVAVAFVMLTLTDMLQISMELGCFLAGVTVSAHGPHMAEQVEALIQPVKDVFACIFFASIGLHVFPSFMGYEMTYLLTFTIFIVTAKFFLSVIVLAVFTPQSPNHVKWIVAAGLSQVSEFSFVLGSRARRLGLISREVYLLILGVTTLSLIISPLLWKVSLWQLRIKAHTRETSCSDTPNQSTETPSSASSFQMVPPESEDDDFVLVTTSLIDNLPEPKRRTVSN